MTEAKESIPSNTVNNGNELKSEQKSEQVEVDISTKPKDNKTSVSFEDIDNLKQYVKEETPGDESRPKTIADEYKGKSIDEIREQLKTEEKEEENKLSIEDYSDMSDFAVDLVDMLFVFAIRWYSLDSTDAPYQPHKEKLEKLKKQLAKLLIRMGAKFPLILIFIATLFAAYLTPIRKAHSNRKEELSRRRKIKEAQLAEEAEIIDDKKPSVKKRGRGGVGK